MMVHHDDGCVTIHQCLLCDCFPTDWFAIPLPMPWHLLWWMLAAVQTAQQVAQLHVGVGVGVGVQRKAWCVETDSAHA